MSQSTINLWLEWHGITDWDKLPNVAGVYELRNNISGISYIGSAVSLRKRGHYKRLVDGVSHNQRLQNAFSKDGPDAFVFRVIVYCDESSLIELEQKHIDEKDFNTLYNTAPVAGSTLGYQFNGEQVDDASLRRRGIASPYEKRKRNWPKVVEDRFKSDLYTKLFRKYRNSPEYKTHCAQIYEYMELSPTWMRLKS